MNWKQSLNLKIDFVSISHGDRQWSIWTLCFPGSSSVTICMWTNYYHFGCQFIFLMLYKLQSTRKFLFLVMNHFSYLFFISIYQVYIRIGFIMKSSCVYITYVVTFTPVFPSCPFLLVMTPFLLPTSSFHSLFMYFFCVDDLIMSSTLGV